MKRATVFVAIGGNVGPVAENLAGAVRLIGKFEETSVVGVSSLYETAPVGGPVNPDSTPAQPSFLNGAVMVETGLAPEEFLQKLLETEKVFGRVREIKDGPRTVDLDIILWDDLVIHTPALTLPHPRMQERGFVLAPLAEVGGNFVHPVLKKTVDELLSALGSLGGVKPSGIDFMREGEN